MNKIKFRKRIGFIGAILGILIAIIGAYQMIGIIRTVDIITLFFGGFGAGAGLVKAIMDYRILKTDTTSTAH
jgi:hypothetical protein